MYLLCHKGSAFRNSLTGMLRISFLYIIVFILMCIMILKTQPLTTILKFCDHSVHIHAKHRISKKSHNPPKDTKCLTKNNDYIIPSSVCVLGP
jgi:hypothetical protein